MTGREMYQRDVQADKKSVQRFISRLPMNYGGTANRVIPVDYERLPEAVKARYERRAEGM